MSKPPELDLRDWILRRRIEHSQQNYVHVNSGVFRLKSSSLEDHLCRMKARQLHMIRIYMSRQNRTRQKLEGYVFLQENLGRVAYQRGYLRERANYLEGVSEPSSLNRNSGDEVEEEFDHGKKAGGTSLISVDSKTEDESENSITEDESENIIDENVREYQGSDLFSSNVVASGKENSLRVKLRISPPTTRSSRTHSLRKPLSDTGNLLLEPQQSRHAVAKWRCPKIDKRHFKPPSKQLSLDCWLVQQK